MAALVLSLLSLAVTQCPTSSVTLLRFKDAVDTHFGQREGAVVLGKLMICFTSWACSSTQAHTHIHSLPEDDPLFMIYIWHPIFQPNSSSVTRIWGLPNSWDLSAGS